MSINSYQVIVAYGLAVRYIDVHKLILGICCILFGSKLISSNRYIWFGSRVY